MQVSVKNVTVLTFVHCITETRNHDTLLAKKKQIKKEKYVTTNEQQLEGAAIVTAALVAEL